MRNARGKRLLALLLLPAQLETHACGACLDQTIRIELPFVGLLTLLFYAWLLSVLVVGIVFRKRLPEKPVFVPRRRTRTLFLLLGTLGFIGLAFLSMGSVLGPGLVISGIWGLYLLAKALTKARMQATCPAEMAFKLIHLGFLGLALAAIVYTSVERRTVSGMIARLDYEVDETSRKLLPELIARGEDAAGPLIRACEESMPCEDSYRRDQMLRSALFCLGRIGGSRTKEFLGGVVRRSGGFSDANSDDQSWLKTACLAYAECAGKEAVPDLKAVFEKSTEQRWVPLGALTRTASKEGVSFALDHLDVLLERANGAGAYEDSYGARVTAEALLYGERSETLRRLHLHRDTMMEGGDPMPQGTDGDLRAEFYWQAGNEDFGRARIEALAAMDKAKLQELVAEARQRWRAALR